MPANTPLGPTVSSTRELVWSTDVFKFNLIIDVSEKSGVRFSAAVYRHSELLRAQKATTDKDRQPNPIVYFEDMTEVEFSQFIHVTGVNWDVTSMVHRDPIFAAIIGAYREGKKEEADSLKTVGEASKGTPPTSPPAVAGNITAPSASK